MGDKIGRNDPCPCGSGKKYKKCCGRASPSPPPPPPPSLPDPRLMERPLLALRKVAESQQFDSEAELMAHLKKVVSQGGVLWTPETPLEEAQELAYRALEVPPGAKRIRLAMEALKKSPDCADAYVLLAEEAAETLEAARDSYRRGVEAGERALGTETFQKYAGRFWGMVETRPYMRAKEGLARCLWLLGERETAIAHFEDLLRLNPNDNQGVRYPLLALLLEQKEMRKAEALLARYKGDGTAAWRFGRALLTFLGHGNIKSARQALSRALKANEHVVPYLLKERRLPRSLPQYIEPGQESEAIEYVTQFQGAWARASGALAWLAAQAAPGAVLKGSAAEDKALAVQMRLDLSAPVAPEVAKPSPGPTTEPPPTLEEWRRLYQATADFKEQEPWRWLGEGDLFGVEDPETREVGYCQTMGQVAMAVFLGPDGFDGYRRAMEKGLKANGFEAAIKQRFLLALCGDRRSLTRRDLDVVRHLGLHFRGRGEWPQFRSQRPGFAPWYLTGQEVRVLATALEQAADIARRVREGLDLYEYVDDDLVLVREWDSEKGSWVDVWRPMPLPPPPSQAPVALDPSRLEQLKRAFPQMVGNWQVDIFSMEAAVEERGQRPYYPRAWLCVDADTGVVIDLVLVVPWISATEQVEAFLDIVTRVGGLPESLAVTRQEARELLLPVVKGLGITLKQQRRLAALNRVKKSLARFLQR